MKIYCQKCNQPTEVLGKRPVFCSNCGSAFASVASTQAVTTQSIPSAPPTKKTPTKAIKRVVVDDEDDDEDENMEVPELDKIEFSIVGNLSRREDIKSIAFDTGPKRPVERPNDGKNYGKMSSKKFWQEFKEEVTRGGRKESSDVE